MVNFENCATFTYKITFIIKVEHKWNGCWQSARQQVNDLFIIAMMYLDVHKDAHCVQCGTRWLKMHSPCVVPLINSINSINTLHLLPDRGQGACCFVLVNSSVAYDRGHIHPMDHICVNGWGFRFEPQHLTFLHWSVSLRLNFGFPLAWWVKDVANRHIVVIYVWEVQGYTKPHLM